LPTTLIPVLSLALFKHGQTVLQGKPKLRLYQHHLKQEPLLNVGPTRDAQLDEKPKHPRTIENKITKARHDLFRRGIGHRPDQPVEPDEYESEACTSGDQTKYNCDKDFLVLTYILSL
jgi:hypothetical protein